MRNVSLVILSLFLAAGCAGDEDADAGTNLLGQKADQAFDGGSICGDTSDATGSDTSSDATGSDTSLDATGSDTSLDAWCPDGGCVEPEVVEPPDPFEAASAVNLHLVAFTGCVEAPYYKSAQVDTGFHMGGTEFWQKWSGGKNPTYSYSQGSPYGRRCMYASARRFEAIMADPPPSLVILKEESNWSGSFFNWNDDYSFSDWGDGTSARLWAWKTHLVKWISQTNKDGSCYLPTLEMVEKLAENCLAKAQTGLGEIQGCNSY